ncbi:uncharacterized protein [Atheta coriaria]|uniref:uncharacterized protein isoform X3 n=1 Tax=Dalotia coriaria TaxID=877792 RepID=UPI0031F3FECC
MAVIRKNVKILPELYSDKLQKGLVLNYAAFTYGTYVNLEKNKGLELQVLLEYCVKYQFVCNLTVSKDKWGEVFGNASDRGPLKWVSVGDVDLTLGGFYMQGRKLEYVDFVGPTVRLGITCLVPKPSLFL